MDVSSSPSTIRLASNRDYVLQLPTEPVTKTVRIEGGRNVTVVSNPNGPAIDILIDNDNGYDNANMGLRFFDQTGTIRVDDIHMGGRYLTEGVQFSAPLADAVLTDLRIMGLIGSKAENHADLIQPWGGLKSLSIDGLTGSSRYQGLMLKADYNYPLGPVTVRRINIEMIEGDTADGRYPNNGGRYSIWTDPNDKTSDVAFETGTCYVDTNSQYKSGTLGGSVWPEVPDGDFIEWPASTRITGRVHKGTPAVDYVPAR